MGAGETTRAQRVSAERNLPIPTTTQQPKHHEAAPYQGQGRGLRGAADVLIDATGQGPDGIGRSRDRGRESQEKPDMQQTSQPAPQRLAGDHVESMTEDRAAVMYRT